MTVAEHQPGGEKILELENTGDLRFLEKGVPNL